MQSRSIFIVIALIACAVCASLIYVDQNDVRSRNSDDESVENVVNKENLVKIKQFILQQGKTETYCNRYNNNPTYQTKNFHFFLDPADPRNTQCDPAKSDFHTLVILTTTPWRYYRVHFGPSQATGDLAFPEVEESLKEILAEIQKKNE